MKLKNNSRECLLLLSSKFLRMLILQECAHLTPGSQRPEHSNGTGLPAAGVPVFLSSLVHLGGSALTLQNTFKRFHGLGQDGSALGKIKPVCVACEG